jgi:hypothetical protein
LLVFILDEDVPESLGEFLTGRGHRVTRCTEHIALGSPDALVAAVAINLKAICVSWNHRDFVKKGKEGALLYPELRFLTFRCDHADGLPRLREHIETIEFVARSKLLRAVIADSNLRLLG